MDRSQETPADVPTTASLFLLPVHLPPEDLGSECTLGPPRDEGAGGAACHGRCK